MLTSHACPIETYCAFVHGKATNEMPKDWTKSAKHDRRCTVHEEDITVRCIEKVTLNENW